MASKAKTLQVKDKEKDDKAADAPEKDSAEAPSPFLDLSDAAVKKMIKQAKKRGFVTFDQLNEVLPSDTTSPEQIEDIMSMLSDMGINVSEAEEADSEEETKEEAEDETDNELVEVTQKAVTEVKKSEPGERTDDPVRMYLREMGTVELLSREGEIAIAKRIEAGREAMIAGLCESPLTFQAIIIWRDELLPRSSACRWRRCARCSRSPRSRCRWKPRSATRRIPTSATSSRTRTRSCRSTPPFSPT